MEAPIDRIAARPVVIDDGVRPRSEDLAVEQAATPGEQVELTESLRPAIVVVMSDVSGTDALCRELRSAADAFIVVISPVAGEIVLGSLDEAGADDVTPSTMSTELLTQIRAGLRQSQASGEPPDNRHASPAGALEIRLDEHRVQVGNCTFELTRTEFRLLAELASAPGRVFTRDVLLATVWGYEYIGNGRLVDSHIWRLRRKLGGIAGNRIATVRGFGYKFVP